MEFALNRLALIIRRAAISALCMACVQWSTAAEALDGVVATVDSQMILKSELDDAKQDAKRQMAARKQTVVDDQTLSQDVLRQLILRKIQLDLVKQNNMMLDDKSLNQAMTELASQQGAPSLVAFQQALDAQKSGNYQRLREQMREDLSINRFRQQRVSSRVRISERDIDNFLASPQSQQVLSDAYRTTHFLIKLPEHASAAAQKQAQEVGEAIRQALLQHMPTPEIIEKFSTDALPVGGGDMGWRKPAELPEAFASYIQALKIDDVTAPIVTPDGVHVIQLSDRKGGQQVMVHQWQVRHILIAPSDMVSAEDAQSRSQELYQKLQQGGNFDELAKTYSNDTGSARSGGDLGWVNSGDMVPAFDAMMKKTPVGDFSQPFQSQFGWHILQVIAEREQDMSEQYRRGVARQTLFQRQYEQEMDNWLREVRAAAFVKILPNSAS